MAVKATSTRLADHGLVLRRRDIEEEARRLQNSLDSIRLAFRRQKGPETSPSRGGLPEEPERSFPERGRRALWRPSSSSAATLAEFGTRAHDVSMPSINSPAAGAPAITWKYSRIWPRSSRQPMAWERCRLRLRPAIFAEAVAQHWIISADVENELVGDGFRFLCHRRCEAGQIEQKALGLPWRKV